MNELFALSLIFIKIGFFAFGGGWSVVGLIQKELVGRNFLSLEDFTMAISISQMTPGPIAINMATYTGYKLYGIIGGLIATISLLLPTLLILGLLGVIEKYIIKDRIRLTKALLPGTLILISYSLIRLSMLHFKDPIIYIIALVSLLIIQYTKISPVIIIFLCGFSGIILYSLLNL